MSAKRTTPAIGAPEDAGQLLDFIRNRQASSRPELERVSGLARATVVQRLRYLFATGLVIEDGAVEGSIGRPAKMLKLDPNFGVVLAADVGESVARVAAVDLSPSILAETTLELDVSSGPQEVLSAIVKACHKLTRQIGRPIERCLGIGLSLPAPVDYVAGRIVGPSVMRGWDQFDICGFVSDSLKIPTRVDNDVNLMAMSEYRRFWPHVEHFLFIKAGTGIGSGIITGGKIYRGAKGASGDIGHIQFEAPKAPLCRCGKAGCVEAVAAGWAIARDLRDQGYEVNNARDVIALLEKGEPICIQRVREAGRVLGEVAADVVSVLNPSAIVVGGTLSRAGDHLLAGIKELIFRRCLPLALDGLGIYLARSDESAGILGAAQLLIDSELAPNRLNATVTRVKGAAVFRREPFAKLADA